MVSHASRRSESPRYLARNGRKVLGWLLLSACCVGAVRPVIGWLYDAEHWPLTQLSISGELQHINEQDVRQALQALMPLKSFMAQAVKPIQHQLEQLPWVAQATVRKQWPNRLIVHLREHHVVACWNIRQLLNSQGRCFVAPLDRCTRGKLPQFYAPNGYEQRLLTTWLVMSPQALQHGLVITSVVVDQRLAWQLILNNRIRLLLGRDEHTARFQRFLVLYPLLDQQQAGMFSTFDLRYAHGAAVSWMSSSKQWLPFNQDRQ